MPHATIYEVITELKAAIKARNNDGIRELLNSDALLTADPATRCYELNNLLLYAVKNRANAEVLGTFLSCLAEEEKGIVLNTQDAEGRTPLFYAKTVKTVKLLCEAGAATNVRDRTGATEIFYVSSPAILRKMIHYGADVSVVNEEGETALFYAKSAKMVKALCEAGLDPDHLNQAGRSALYSPSPMAWRFTTIARTGSGSIEGAEMLIEQGAQVVLAKTRHPYSLLYDNGRGLHNRPSWNDYIMPVASVLLNHGLPTQDITNEPTSPLLELGEAFKPGKALPKPTSIAYHLLIHCLFMLSQDKSRNYFPGNTAFYQVALLLVKSGVLIDPDFVEASKTGGVLQDSQVVLPLPQQLEQLRPNTTKDLIASFQDLGMEIVPREIDSPEDRRVIEQAQRNQKRWSHRGFLMCAAIQQRVLAAERKAAREGGVEDHDVAPYAISANGYATFKLKAGVASETSGDTVMVDVDRGASASASVSAGAGSRRSDSWSQGETNKRSATEAGLSFGR